MNEKICYWRTAYMGPCVGPVERAEWIEGAGRRTSMPDHWYWCDHHLEELNRQEERPVARRIHKLVDTTTLELDFSTETK